MFFAEQTAQRIHGAKQRTFGAKPGFGTSVSAGRNTVKAPRNTRLTAAPSHCSGRAQAPFDRRREAVSAVLCRGCRKRSY